MNARERLRNAGRTTVRYFVVLALMVGNPVLAHDPLREDGGHHHDHANIEPTAARPDLAEVRSLVVKFRETGDDTHLDKAWKILEPLIEQASNDPETLIAAAFVAQSRHEFALARQLISHAQSIKRNNDEGWLLLASIHLVRGETGPAARACGQLRTVPPLIVLTCNARVALAKGNHTQALNLLRNVLTVIDAREIPPDMLAWSYSVAGDLAVAAGQLPEARQFFQRSLGISDRTQVRAALVDVLLEENEHELAWRVLESGTAALPLLVRQFIVAKRLNRLPELAPELKKVEREFGEWIAAEDWLHAREMARFYVDVVERPDLARRLALINIGLQRESEDLLLERRTRRPDVS